MLQEKKDKIKKYQSKNIKNYQEFHKFKEPIDLLSVNIDQIVVSYKFT